jgi:pyruvate dehydrogenase E1 component alpha subunit
MPDPDGTAMFDYVYADRHPVMERERADYLAYQAGFTDGGSDR